MREGLHTSILLFLLKILQGCAQAVVVGDPMEVVGLSFSLCSYVRQVADPSLMSNWRVSRPEPGVSMLDCRFLGSPESHQSQDAMFFTKIS